MSKKKKEPMYTIRLALKTNEADEHFLSKCFYFGWQIRNHVVKYAINHLYQLSCDKEYNSARAEYRDKGYGGLSEEQVASLSAEDRKHRSILQRTMNDCARKHGVTKNDLEKSIKQMRSKYSRYISAMQGQKIADEVWCGLQKVLYGDGKHLNFKRLADFDSIGQKDFSNGVKLNDGWNSTTFMKRRFKLVIPDDQYVQEVVSHPQTVKYCMLKRIEFNSGYRYYIIATIVGYPPSKGRPSGKKSKVGIDLGPSTVAVESENSVMLENLAPQSVEYERKIRKLQKQLDHKMRLLNPGNYNPDGTVRQGKKSWTLNKPVRRLRRQIRVLYRKQTAYIKNSHGCQLNRIIDSASAVIIEPMKWASLAKRSKQTERSDKLSTVKKRDGAVRQIHKYKKKKRFGRSVKNHSPGWFQSELKRKAELRGVPFAQINTKKYKASQLDHSTGEYTPAGLEKRYKVIDGQTVQRDLYSAFLIRHAMNTEQPDFDECSKDFIHFVQLQNQLLSEMKVSGISNKPCWGF